MSPAEAFAPAMQKANPYKCSVKMSYKAFETIVTFVEQGWELKPGALVS